MRLSKGNPRKAIAAALAGIFMTWPTVSEATEFIFTRIVDSHTAIPGGRGTFTGFSTPAIDRGDANHAFDNEPDENGGFINIGAYGNTAQASRGEVEFVRLLVPDGGESWTVGDTFVVRWRNHAFVGTVDINLKDRNSVV